MDTIVDDTPPPPKPLRQQVRELEPGQSLLAPAAEMQTLRSTASAVGTEFPKRKYRCSMTPDGPRVWRTA